MATDARVVLDASALLAAIYDEPGAGVVRDALDSATMSTVNLAEVIGKLRTEAGWSSAEVMAGLDLPLDEVAFDIDMARVAGDLVPATRRLGLSLGDRACIATACCLGIPVVMTADAAWAKLRLTDIEVVLIR